MNSTNVLTTTLAVIGFALAYYFYDLGENKREPTFIVDPFRPLLVEANSIEGFPLKIVDLNGRTLNENVSMVRFYFWNEGGEAIKKAHVLQPLRVEFTATESQIIDFRILSNTRSEITGLELKRIEGSNNNLALEFEILEEGDGFSAQVIYVGDEYAPVKLLGAIEGVRKVRTNNDIATLDVAKLATYRFFSIFLAIALLLAAVGGIIFMIEKVGSSVWYNKVIPIASITRKFEALPNPIRIIISAWFPILFAVFFVFAVISSSRRDFETDMNVAVPVDLRTTSQSKVP